MGSGILEVERNLIFETAPYESVDQRTLKVTARCADGIPADLQWDARSWCVRPAKYWREGVHLCARHNYKAEKAGFVRAYGERPSVCDVEECGRIVDAKRLCSKHYKRLLRGSTVVRADERAVIVP